MYLELSLSILTFAIALNGLLYQPKKDRDKPARWKNLNLLGKLNFSALFMLFLANIYLGWSTTEENREKANKISTLQESLDKLSESNGRLHSAHEKLKVDNTEIMQAQKILQAGNTELKKAHKILQTDNTELKATSSSIVDQNDKLLNDNQELIGKQVRLTSQNTQLIKSIADLSQTALNIKNSSDGINKKLTKHYLSISFKSIEVTKDCDKDSEGEIYYKLRVNGDIISELNVSQASSADSGTFIPINSQNYNLPLFGTEDKVNISGYVRERDSKNKLTRKWYYTEVGNFSKNIIASRAVGNSQIHLESYDGCSVIVHYEAKLISK